MRLETPDELARRSVLADQWQEAGDPRGEVLALQVALAREDLPREPSIKARRRLHGLRATKPPGWMRESIEIHVDALLRDHAEIAARAPFLRRIALSGLTHWSDIDDAGVTKEALDAMTTKIHAVLDLPGFGAIDGLMLTDASARWMHAGEMSRYADGEVVDRFLFMRLLSSGRLAKLRHIAIHDARLETVRALTQDPTRLESLEISNILDAPLHWTPEAMDALGTRTTNLRPRRLVLRTHRDPRGLFAALADHEFVSRVDDLSLNQLVEIPFLHRLRRLSAQIDDLAPLLQLENLRELTLFGNVLTPETAKTFLQSPLARSLELLDLRTEKQVKPIASYLRDRWDGILLV